METLQSIVNAFWEWTALPQKLWNITDISTLQKDPLYFPNFDELRSLCISRINTLLDNDETNCFLLCMGLDNEEERILDECKRTGNVEFLENLVLKGVSFSQWETRWQVAELLCQEVPNQKEYLRILLKDSNSYVRKRAHNVMNRISQ